MENENILELTKENLIKCDFDRDVIERLLTWDNYSPQTTQNNLGTFFASNIENKIYMGIEAHRKIYLGDKENPRFPFNELGLIREYYELAQSNFLKASKKRLTLIYNEETEKQKFREGEIRKASEIFKECEAKPDLRFNYNNRRFVIWKDYLTWLNNPNQSEPIDKSKGSAQTKDLRDKLQKIYLGLTFKQVDESYKCFNNYIFKDITFDEYLICFDLDEPIEKYPTFINGNIAKFVKFLNGLKAFTMNHKTATARFGIKNYKQSNLQGIADNKKNRAFLKQIEAIYKLNVIKIN